MGNGSDYFSVHSHTAFSPMDGMGKVADHVARVAALGQPGFALTDHGGMGGTVQAYKECRKAGIAFYPGNEFYVCQDVNDADTHGTRWHLGLLALDFAGYQALSKLTTLSWKEGRFYYKPLIDLSDLAFLHDEGYASHLACLTGCYSGLVVNRWEGPDPRGHAANVIRTLAHWFPHTYVELQNHGIDWENGFSDEDIALELADIAEYMGLPVVIGGDSHYVKQHEQSVHDLMKDICYFGDGEDNHFSGGPYHLWEADAIKAVFPKRMHADIEAGHSDLLDKNRVVIPALENYSFNVPKMFDSPDRRLALMTYKGLTALGLTDQPHLDRAGEELAVIKAMGFANYHLLVKVHVTDWCRDNGIIVNTRGSGNGCLVNYALGITQVDPLVWNTSFPRYLSLDRMKPPDLDIDVDFRGRWRLVEHLRAVFPTMTQIGTYSKIGITIDPETGEESGSVLVQYMAAHRRKDPAFDGMVRVEHRQPLEALARTEVYKSMGTNAAGFVLPGRGHPIDKYLPQGRIISSNTTLTQYHKDDVEALGYLKLDVLGLRALQTLNGTLTRIGRQPNEWGWIPWDDYDACKLIRSGNGCGLFQFEGFSNSKGAREMGVKSTLDVILALALYRPALMHGGQKDAYLANRRSSKARQSRLHPLFDHVLSDTLGIPVFQEQIMEMLKALGMTYADYNDLMTAVKASNAAIHGAGATFRRVRPIFYDLCEDAGLTPSEQDDAWHAVVGFTEYGFNRAHSTSYGIMAYRSAYLKAHYPLEYMASALEVWAEVPDKVRWYQSESKRLGIQIVRADVNVSEVSWTIDPMRRNALRKGLVSLPGVGENVASAIVDNRPPGGYADVADFLARVPARPVSGGKAWAKTGTPNGVCKVLLDSGAFRTLVP